GTAVARSCGRRGRADPSSRSRCRARKSAGPLAPLLLVALHVLVVGLWSGRRRVRRRVPQTLVDDGGQRRGIELRESQGARGLEGAHRPSARPDLLQRRPRRRPPGRAEGPFELRGKKAAKEWNDAGGEDVGLQRPAACVVVREDAVQRALQEAAVERTLRLGRLYAIAARSEERRVGKEWRCGWWRRHVKKE